MSLERAALESLDFLISSEEGKFFAMHPVTCHMAAVYWAFRALNKNEKESRTALKAITRSACPGCLGTGIHGSLQPQAYGRLFCANAALLDGLFMAGDVLVMPHTQLPMHSMVVVGRTGNPERPLIRGFNNHMTFQTSVPAPPYMKYDNVTRDLGTRVNPAANVYYIKEYTYLRAAHAALAGVAG